VTAGGATDESVRPDGTTFVDGRLHHPHGDHCDDHGTVAVV
jgi:hypothetical protein